ncbi:MAG: uncharacterized protein KVP18_002744 [Porospora cf. gigantea A]|uniref:uncharacterized protein n=1 Tax=Porospora cf. gigantea A TaxID=2853593 RepID=UPI00355937BD|nr:MAG: hypothetical protein KVP18_002744 [Porospora cf. gigantea A]
MLVLVVVVCAAIRVPFHDIQTCDVDNHVVLSEINQRRAEHNTTALRLDHSLEHMAFRRCRIPTGRRAGLELRKQQLFLSEHKLVDVWYSSSQSFDLNEMVPKINLSEKGGDFVDVSVMLGQHAVVVEAKRACRLRVLC